MNVSAWSIRRPVPATLLFVLLTVLGLMGFNAMKVQNFPDIDLPTIVVSAALPGAAPAQLETEVVRKIENAVSSLQGVRHITSRAQEGVAVVAVEFRLERPVQEALDDVRDAVSRVRSDLPAALRDPVITKVNTAGTPILTYTVASDRLDAEALSWFVDDTVTKALLAVRGVGQVNRVGGVTREVRVELDPGQLLALNATAADISRQLRSVQQDTAGGRTDLGGGEQAVRTVAAVQSAEELARLSVTLADGRRLRLDQVGRVIDTVAEPRSAALLDGKPVVAFEVLRAVRAGEVEVGAGVRERLQRLREEVPDVRIVETHNLVDPAADTYHGSMLLLLEGAVLAVIVVGLFLRDWRATLLSATALPLSVVPAWAVMHYGFGFSINLITLLSLSLVIGVLVDDAIVEVENIMRHLRMGKSPMQAALDAADEIGLAVIATTFTLIAVFLPTAFMAGVPGRFFVQFGWTAAIAVFFSLVVARMLTPMMASRMLRKPPAEHRPPAWLTRYRLAVRWCLRHRGWTMGLAALFFVGSLALVPLLPSGFIPPDDLDQTQVNLTLPPGATYAQTLVAAEHARQVVMRHPRVRSVYTVVGGNSGAAGPFAVAGATEVRTATLTLKLAPRSERQGVTKQAIEAQLRQTLVEVPGVRVTLGFGGGSDKFTVMITGDDGRVLAEHARRVETELRTLQGVGAITSSASLVRPELSVRPDVERAADLGVTAAAISDTLRVATAGDYEQALAKLNFSQRQVPVVVKLAADARTDVDLLARLPVPGARGSVPLASVATLTIDSGPAQIDRYDRRRNVTFDVELNQRPLGEVAQQALALPTLTQLPTGLAVVPAGDAEAMAELFNSFGLAMLTGVLCIYIVLVLLFGNFVQPCTILGALVLSVPGAILALFITHTSISMPSLIGLIMLMGITTKNSILLVDYIIVARFELGMNRAAAVADACRKRARPIVMTTIAMGAGMVPIALGIGTDPSFRAPMAIVVIGGLITSTVLSLLVIPVIYTQVDDLGRWTYAMRWRWQQKQLRRRERVEPQIDEPRQESPVLTAEQRALLWQDTRQELFFDSVQPAADKAPGPEAVPGPAAPAANLAAAPPAAAGPSAADAAAASRTPAPAAAAVPPPVSGPRSGLSPMFWPSSFWPSAAPLPPRAADGPAGQNPSDRWPKDA